MPVAKPQVLYHGSQYDLACLMPQQAYDGLSDIGTANAVFATTLRELALVFALGAIPDANGRITRLVQSLQPLQVLFLEGTPNRGGLGYIYMLSSDSFAPLDDLQWVSSDAVIPLHKETISVDNYLHLVQNVSEDERLRLLAQFNQEQRRG